MPNNVAKPRRSRKKVDAAASPMMATLYAEHRHMATMLKLLEKQLDLIESDGAVDAHVVYESMHYMTQYPDRFHHPREDVIFQRAAQLSAELADDVDAMQRDHDRMAISGTDALQAISQWRAGQCDAQSVVKTGRAYIADLFRHMKTEEQQVFPRIEATLTSDDWRELSEDDTLLPAPDPVFGARVDREFRNVARSARRAMRNGVENAVMTEWLGLETLMESLEVLSIARDHSRSSTREHLRETSEQCKEIVSAGLMQAPLKCAACTLRQYGSWLSEHAAITRDTLGDIGTVRDRFRTQLRVLKGSDERPPN